MVHEACEAQGVGDSLLVGETRELGPVRLVAGLGAAQHQHAQIGDVGPEHGDGPHEHVDSLLRREPGGARHVEGVRRRGRCRLERARVDGVGDDVDPRRCGQRPGRRPGDGDHRGRRARCDGGDEPTRLGAAHLPHRGDACQAGGRPGQAPAPVAEHVHHVGAPHMASEPRPVPRQGRGRGQGAATACRLAVDEKGVRCLHHVHVEAGPTKAIGGETVGRKHDFGRPCTSPQPGRQ